jgi:hypothetical protein
MEMAIGFLIAVAIGMTGVGGGVLTAPVLILFLGLPAPVAVGTSLVFVTIVKAVAAPVYLVREQVNWKVLGLLLAGGVPAVIAGSVLLKRVHESGLNGFVLALVGLTVGTSALVNLFHLALRRERTGAEERRGLLVLLSAGIGLEVGFSSAGAGALGTVALMHFTRLLPAEIVGTDLFYGLFLSAIGGGFHLLAENYAAVVLMKLAAGGVAGALVGAQLAGIFPSRLMRTALSLWLVVMGAQLCYRGVGSLLNRV